jgi:ABC-2 type transport system permease protein
VHLTALWLIDNTGVTLLANILLTFFSGFVLPIAFFPPWLATIANWLPFRAISGLPTQVFLGQLNDAQVANALLVQLFWAAALTGVALFVLRLAMHKAVVQGGRR